MDEIRVALVDDHALVRQGLRAMIDREPDLRVVGEASSARLATAMLDRVQPKVMLLDLKLSGPASAPATCPACSARSGSADRTPITTSVRRPGRC